MSDSWIIVIPEDPNHVPDEDAKARSVEWAQRATGGADEVAAIVADTPQFFDCGSNFERIRCAACNAALSDDWWGSRMDEEHRASFPLRKYALPCCGAARTLHELAYEWPQGFGRFARSMRNPRVGQLGAAQVAELQALLMVPLRVIHRHL